MKALTICQPFAELVARGEKRVENRSWRTHYRGPLAIHAGRSRAWLKTYRPIDGLTFGAVIAMAELIGCVPVGELGTLLDRSLVSHPHAHGPWCWILGDVQRLATPVASNGRQGLWDLPPNVLRAIHRQKAAATF